MRVTPTIRKHFGPRLAALGFAAAPGLGTVWIKETPGSPPLMVEVDKERWFNRFHVTLRRRGRPEELFHVAEAAGLRWYEYSNEAELAGAVQLAAAHFDQWGRPWLAGESVDSPALSALRQHHAEAALGRHQHEAQVAQVRDDRSRLLAADRRVATERRGGVSRDREQLMALAIIMVWYVSIGALAAAGAMHLSHRFVPAKHEATVYGLFLVAIAAFYLACTSYFGNAAAWSLEAVAVVAFAAMGCLGTRVPVVLMAGYALHGGWDLLHEVQAHMQVNVFGGREATGIPLAYGAFCAAFDWAMVVYFVYRRRHWAAAWKSPA